MIFSCPVCGEEIRLGVHIPNLYVAASGLAELLEEAQAMRGTDGESAFQVFSVAREEVGDHEEMHVERLPEDDPLVEHYVEYFRRQLAQCDTVESFLAEVDEK